MIAPVVIANQTREGLVSPGGWSEVGRHDAGRQAGRRDSGRAFARGQQQRRQQQRGEAGSFHEGLLIMSSEC